MFEIVRYPEKYPVYRNLDYTKCKQYLTLFNDKLRQNKFRTEKTETFITLSSPYKEDVIYSIEYNEH